MTNVSKFVLVVASAALFGALAFTIAIGNYLSFNVRVPGFFLMFVLFTAALSFHQFYLKDIISTGVLLRVWLMFSALFVPNLLVFSGIRGLSEVAYFLSFLVSVLFAVMLQAQETRKIADITLMFLSTVWIQLTGVILLKQFGLLPAEVIASFDAIGIETFKNIRLLLTGILALWIIGIAIGNAWGAPRILGPFEIPLIPSPQIDPNANPVVSFLQHFAHVLVVVFVNPVLITGIVNYFFFIVIRLVVDALARVVRELIKKVRDTLRGYYYVLLFLGVHILLILSAIWVRNLYAALEGYTLTDIGVLVILRWAGCLAVVALIIKTVFLHLFFIPSKSTGKNNWSILVINLRQSLTDLTHFVIAVSLIVEFAALFVWIYAFASGYSQVKTWGPFFMNYLLVIGVIGVLVLGYYNLFHKKTSTQPAEADEVSYGFRDITWQPVRMIWFVVILFVMLVAGFYLYPTISELINKGPAEEEEATTPIQNQEPVKMDTAARSQAKTLAERSKILMDAGEYDEAYRLITIAANISGIPTEDKKVYTDKQQVILELMKKKGKSKPKS